MLFNSLEFLIFFPTVVLVYFIIPNRIKYIWLLAASYYFYMCWNVKYALLILFSTAVTYTSGLLIGACPSSRSASLKKLIVAGSFILNLGVLFYFKYINFAFKTLAKAFALIHIELNIPTIDVLLPVGISFFTFQALSYTMDVYRGEIYAEKNFLRYALFVSFFPQLVAGPIERSKNLLTQLSVPKKFDFFRAKEGVLLMLWGFFLKIVLADRIAIFVDTVYADSGKFGGWYLILATLLFASQIYCDFAGYSTIACGAAKILGINLMENFDAPYLSTSVASFWRRWHISLTSWFRDYLYIPLGGACKGKLRKYLNKMIVFLVSGLWHGASISYVIWGGLNAFYQIAGEALTPVRNKIGLKANSLSSKILGGVITFVLIDFSFIFFRANGFKAALKIGKKIFTASNPWVLFDGSIYNCGLDSKNFWLMLICLAILFVADIMKRRGVSVRLVILRQSVWFQCLIVILAILGILIFGIWGPGYSQTNFIYFQF